jgi:circadian clock protein KaiB
LFEKLIVAPNKPAHYALRLYVSGTTARSTRAIANIRALCDEHLPGRHDLEVVDLYQQPGTAVANHIVAAPTLVKMHPPPAKRMVGDLSDRAKLIADLSLPQSGPASIAGK